MVKKTTKRNFTKPCHTLGWCPYGWIVELFPSRGKPVSWNGKDLGIKPIGDGEILSCDICGHDCPVFYAGEGNVERSALPALSHKQENDYVLNDNHSSVWIEVGDIVVYIRTKNDGAPLDGVAVDLMELGDEDGDALDSTIAFHKERKKGEQG